MVKALMKIKESRETAAVAVPEWARGVYCNVLRPDTSLEERERLAGEHQFRQRAVEAVRLSRWANAFLKVKKTLMMGYRCQRAAEVSGWRRFRGMAEYLKEYSSLGRWVDACGQASVSALENLEKYKKDLTPNMLRCLRPLITPESRRALLPVMMKNKVTMHELELEASTIERKLWVGWHWREGNPHIDPARLEDTALRAWFGRSVGDVRHLKVNLGRQSLEEEEDRPSMEKLMEAPVYHLPQYQSLRQGLRQPKAQFDLTTGEDPSIFSITPVHPQPVEGS